MEIFNIELSKPWKRGEMCDVLTAIAFLRHTVVTTKYIGQGNIYFPI